MDKSRRVVLRGWAWSRARLGTVKKCDFNSENAILIACEYYDAPTSRISCLERRDFSLASAVDLAWNYITHAI